MPNFDAFINRYESERFLQYIHWIIHKWIYLVSPSFAERLYKLKGYEIVFICDDSGSMSAPVGESLLHLTFSYYSCIYWRINSLGESTNPYEKSKTRCKI
jgi:hypothetical protein